MSDRDLEFIGREFAAFLRPDMTVHEKFCSAAAQTHHNLRMTEKHLGFAAVRSLVINREPQTIDSEIELHFADTGIWPDGAKKPVHSAL